MMDEEERQRKLLAGKQKVIESADIIYEIRTCILYILPPDADTTSKSASLWAAETELMNKSFNYGA